MIRIVASAGGATGATAPCTDPLAILRAFYDSNDARGVRGHLPGSPPDGPIYHETRIGVSGDMVRFTLEPDRRRPNGRPYPPFKVEARVNACKIESLTVVEEVTWL